MQILIVYNDVRLRGLILNNHSSWTTGRRFQTREGRFWCWWKTEVLALKYLRLCLKSRRSLNCVFKGHKIYCKLGAWICVKKQLMESGEMLQSKWVKDCKWDWEVNKSHNVQRLATFTYLNWVCCIMNEQKNYSWL